MISKETIKILIQRMTAFISTAVSKVVQAVKRFAASHRQAFISLAVIFAGLVLAIVLVLGRRSPQKAEVKALAPLVKVRQLNAENIRMVVSGFGTVSPKVQVEVAPQVSGNVVYMHPEFKAGGFIKAGQELLRIDRRDYELAVQQAESGVAAAVVQLDIEKAEAEVARKEWDQINPGKEPESSLVLREPQIRQAQAQLESAKAVLATARLNLERTSLKLPIDVRVVSESVDLGQYLAVGRAVGSAYGIDFVEIELPLEDRELTWFDVPVNSSLANPENSSSKGSAVNVVAEFAGGIHTWRGYVTRMTGEVDRTSRLVAVVIEVPEPLKSFAGRPALVPGMFVEVRIEGNELKNAIAVPRDAIRGRNEIWVVEDGRLYVRSLDVVRFDKEYAYVTSGLADGAIIVVSSLDVVVDGMSVRTQFEEK